MQFLNIDALTGYSVALNASAWRLWKSCFVTGSGPYLPRLCLETLRLCAMLPVCFLVGAGWECLAGSFRRVRGKCVRSATEP
jgi:hypothetical protein